MHESTAPSLGESQTFVYENGVYREVGKSTTSISTFTVNGKDGTVYTIYPDVYSDGEWIIRVRPPKGTSFENIVNTVRTWSD